MHIFVKGLAGLYFTIVALPNDTVSSFKESIEARDGTPHDMQTLLWKGRLLYDNQVLADIGLEDESTVHLIIRLRGGMFHKSSGRFDLDTMY